ncbi:hypothetical protein LOTGIDRAFT_173515 [Lottia gigantea]|uniref:Retrotransposon gag domain-containing protein n=1 Tax=Lottia gigantea TaxID=225164 RepID=V4CD09_LOTGI|nr:hypothetical protein LOTGIDRAFT_173515 [Lottia gigantea]ESO99799.1 hypothetical protein LOTGIDRAFT_173515 [Lottia gigantea]
MSSLEDLEQAVSQLSSSYERDVTALERRIQQYRNTRLNVSPASDIELVSSTSRGACTPTLFSETASTPLSTQSSNHSMFCTKINQRATSTPAFGLFDPDPTFSRPACTRVEGDQVRSTVAESSRPHGEVPPRPSRVSFDVPAERTYTRSRYAKPVAMPPKFDGEGSLVDYMVQFEVTAEINGWNENEKARFLAISLGGKARDIFGTFRADDDCLDKALRQKFDPPELAEMYKVQLRERRRKAGESVPDFASCIRMIVDKAYPTSSDFIKEEMVKDHFVQYFGNGQMRMLVSQARPRDLNSALHHAMELEAIKCSDPDTRTASVTNVKDKPAKKSTDLGNKEMKVLIMARSEEIKLLKQKVETKGNESKQDEI